ncbi:MAG: hypothetical protein WBA84_10045 [Carnobacterium sp.]|uniref:hypothetical protein n=1 Tax=Carnobacterium sp. TaxID=48221 RepID=UPI003C761860
MSEKNFGLEKVPEIKRATDYMESKGIYFMSWFINLNNYVVEGEFLGKYVLVLIKNEKLYLFNEYKWESIEQEQMKESDAND